MELDSNKFFFLISRRPLRFNLPQKDYHDYLSAISDKKEKILLERTLSFKYNKTKYSFRKLLPNMVTSNLNRDEV